DPERGLVRQPAERPDRGRDPLARVDPPEVEKAPFPIALGGAREPLEVDARVGHPGPRKPPARLAGAPAPRLGNEQPLAGLAEPRRMSSYPPRWCGGYMLPTVRTRIRAPASGAGSSRPGARGGRRRPPRSRPARSVARSDPTVAPGRGAIADKGRSQRGRAAP